MKKKKRKINLFHLIARILLVLFVGITLYTFIVSNVLKKDTVNYFGYTFYNVSTGSMSGTIEVDDIIFVRLSNSNLKKGDIITYRNSNDDLVTHRIQWIDDDEIVTKGDNNMTNDNPITRDDVVGKVFFYTSSKSCIQMIVIFFILLLAVSLIRFEKLFENYVEMEEKPVYDFDRDVLPQDIFSSPEDRKNEHSGLTVSIPMEEVEEIKRIIERQDYCEEPEILEIEVLDFDKNKVVTISEDERRKENHLIELVDNLLKAKHNSINVSKINKKWLIKYQYVYKISNIIFYRDTKYLYENIVRPSFREIYDYDLDKIGLYENLRNKIYDMPIYIYLKLLFLAVLYNDEEFFDGIFKIMKYKVMIDKNDNFRTIKKDDKYAIKQVRQLIELIERVSNKFDNKNIFNLEREKRLIKIRSED